MKKLILFTGIAIYTLFALTVFIDRNAEVRFYPPETAPHFEAASASSSPPALYIVTEKSGRIAVKNTENGKTILTDTPVSTLTESDRRLLRNGIELRTKNELRRVLEDYCS